MSQSNMLDPTPGLPDDTPISDAEFPVIRDFPACDSSAMGAKC
jgi:hypothetical protein